MCLKYILISRVMRDFAPKCCSLRGKRICVCVYMYFYVCTFVCMCVHVCLKRCSCTACRLTFNYLNHSAKWLHTNKLQAVNMCWYLWLCPGGHTYRYIYIYNFIYINIYELYMKYMQLSVFSFCASCATNCMSMQSGWQKCAN